MRHFQLLILVFIAQMSWGQTNYIITPNSVGDIKLGEQMSKFFDMFPSETITKVPGWYYGLDGDGEGSLVILNQSDTLMFVWSKDYGKTIGGVVCLSDVYRTIDGLGINSTLGEIEKLHSYVYLRPDYNNESVEYVTPKYKNGIIHFETISPTGVQIGIYDPNSQDEPETTEYDRTKKIDRLVIWQ